MARITSAARLLLCAALLPAAVFGSTAGAAETDEGIRIGIDLLAQGKVDEAIRQFKAVEKKAGGKCADCLLGLAKAYNAKGDARAALKSADAILKAGTSPLEGLAQNERGIALIASAGSDAAKLAAAESAFRRAWELTGAELAQFNLAVTLLKLERDEEGVALLRTLLEKNPDSKRADAARDLVARPERARKHLLPNVELVTLSGERFTTDSLFGKVVLIDFWGTWCGPCRRAIPSLKRLSARRAGDPFVLVGIANDPDRDVLERFLRENEIDWPQVQDGERKVIERFDVNSYPTYVLVGHDGEIVFVRSGWSDEIEREVSMRVGRAIKTAEKGAKKSG